MNAAIALVGFFGIIVFVFGIVAASVTYEDWAPKLGRLFTPAQRGISEKHQHRWSKWTLVKSVEVHLYSEVDEGKGLPDRYDVVLKRECVRCGLPQTQTQRGLDSKWRG